MCSWNVSRISRSTAVHRGDPWLDRAPLSPSGKACVTVTGSLGPAGSSSVFLGRCRYTTHTCSTAGGRLAAARTHGRLRGGMIGDMWMRPRSLRLAAQDVALSRRKQGFESPRERQQNQAVTQASPSCPALELPYATRTPVRQPRAPGLLRRSGFLLRSLGPR